VSLDFSPKFGSSPTFTPQIVDGIVRTLGQRDGQASFALLTELMSAEPDNLRNDLRSGTDFGFWNFAPDGMVKLRINLDFDEGKWTPYSLARFLHTSLLESPKGNLNDQENWNSLTGLMAWSFSLKISSPKDGVIEVVRIGDNKEFEDIGRKTGLSEGLVMNQTQMPAARRWLKAFNVSMSIGKEVVIFPAIVSEAAGLIFDSMENLADISAKDFAIQIRKLCPFLPGGQFGKKWTELSTSHIPSTSSGLIDMASDFTFSQMESLALATFASKGIITYEHKNDAPDGYQITAGSNSGKLITLIKKNRKIDVSR